MKRIWFAMTLAVLATIFTIAGCGGSSTAGGGGGGGGGISSGFVALYATDSMDGNDHVWVKIFKITVNSSTGPQTAFDDSVGTVVDLKSLRDPQGAKFQFLSLSKVTGGPFNSATVVMDKDLTIVPAGGKTGVSKKFDAKFDDKSGHSAITFNFSKPLGLGGSDDKLVVDFDLANWDDNAGKISPVLKDSNDSPGLGDDRRHVEDDHEGSIVSLSGTSPDQDFDLAFGGGRSFHVKTDKNTVVFNSDNKPNPVLKNAAKVQVRGKFIAAKGYMLAVSIKIENENHLKGEVEAKGTPSNIVGTTSFDVVIVEAERFVPLDKSVKVVTTDKTVLRDDHGVQLTSADFYAALATTTSVKVEGTYDESTGTITAIRCKLDATKGGGDGGGNNEAQAKGAVTDINEANGTFSVALSEWEGFNGSVGLKLSVTTTTDTKFLDKKGATIDKSAFFAALAQSHHVEIRGSFTAGAITALKCRIEDN